MVDRNVQVETLVANFHLESMDVVHYQMQLVVLMTFIVVQMDILVMEVVGLICFRLYFLKRI